jgi:hypothetical protein
MQLQTVHSKKDLQAFISLPQQIYRNDPCWVEPLLGEIHGQFYYKPLPDPCQPKLCVEINYVLEDNSPMNNAIIKLDAKPLRKYRVYELSI